MVTTLKFIKRSWAVLLFIPFVASGLLSCSPAAANPSNPSKKALSLDKAYTFAGVIVDRSRKVKRNETTAEYVVMDKMPAGKNSARSYDVVFVVRPSSMAKGKILTLTSGPVQSCRPYLSTFLTKTLSPKRIAKAYKGAKLALVDKDPTAKSLAAQLAKDGWLSDCSAKPKGKVDVFQTLVVNASDA